MFLSYTEKLRRPDVNADKQRTISRFTCDICILSEDQVIAWETETDLAVHKKDLHSDYYKSLQDRFPLRFCTICMTLLDSEDDLIKHIKFQHLCSSPMARRVEREIFFCDHCDRFFFSKRVLEIHMLYFHLYTTVQKRAIKKKFLCPKCNKYISLKSAWYHFQHHEIPSITICDICLEPHKTLLDLMSHMYTHPMLYKCEVCNIDLQKESAFNDHVDLHRRNGTEKTICSKMKQKLLLNIGMATKQLRFRYNVHNVFKGAALPNVVHICVLCREIRGSEAEVANHMLTEHESITVRPASRRTFPCSCGLEFISRVLLKHHVFKLKGEHKAVDAESRPPPEVKSSGTADSTESQFMIYQMEQNIDSPQTIETELPFLNSEIEIIPITEDGNTKNRYENTCQNDVDVTRKSDNVIELSDDNVEVEIIRMPLKRTEIHRTCDSEDQEMDRSSDSSEDIVFL